ncbi:MAG: diguanylate cyclase [Gemmatimonadaceae bacterium]|nr:diguanylate cyclase [Gemmatimonadaceae bacterium]NUQ91701.1 diguanylate cyclase [Gemmatimonadaceae bacterium]
MRRAVPPRCPIRIDDLTRLPLRSTFIEAATAAMETARAEGRAVSLIVMDVDHFKLVNDTYGHLQGDDVLVGVAELIRKNLRGSDVAARYAGDEFVALLPDTPADAAREVAERICAGIRGHTFFLRDRSGSVLVTSSMGVASFPEHAGDYDTLFAAADRALYQVKRQGRDGVAIASITDEAPTHLPLSIERFVGRVDELRAMVKLLEEAGEGHPKVVAVSGEAGVGKTTLIKQLEPEVRLRAGSLVTGRAHEADVQAPYAPWAEVIGAIRRLDIVPKHPWRELPRLVPALGADAPFEDSNVGSKYMLLEEIAEYVRLAARERTLVIVLDDMQWADSASWDTLEYLVPQLENERLLICLTIRAEETYGETLERRRRLSRNELFTEMTLSRLTRDELKQWVEAAFHRQDVGRELLSFLYRHTEGNPLFVVQVLRTLVDEGAVWYTGERWEWRAVSELRLPVGVSDLISRRLSRLSAEAQAILTTAAVIGREFDLDLAIEAGAGSEEELLDAVDEGIRASVLQATADRESDRYAFTHGKMAEVLRESVNPRRLRRMHERVAQALERRTPDAAAEIATHYDRGGNAEKAYNYAILAADQAKAVYAHTEGTEFLHIAERNAASPAHLADVRVRLAQIAEAMGQYVEAQELCDLAIDWFEGQGDRKRSLSLRVMRERLRGLLGQPARQTLDAAVALDAEAQRLGADAERVSLLKMISLSQWRLGDTQASERAAWEAVRLAEKVAEPALLGDSLMRLGVAIQPDQPTQSLEIQKRALALWESLGDRRGQARCHNNLGTVYVALGRWEEAKRHLTTAIAIGRTSGTPDLWGLAALNLGVVYLKGGDFDRARELFGESLALFAAAKNSERQLYALYNLAHLDRDRAEYNSAAELYDVTTSLAQRIGQSEVEIGATAGLGLSLLAQGKTAPAREKFEAADERMRSRRDWFQGRELVETLGVQVMASDGRTAEALSRFERALAMAEAADLYIAAWLTAACANALYEVAPDRVRQLAESYSGRVKGMGYSEIDRQLEELLART